MSSPIPMDETMWNGLIHSGIAGTMFGLPYVPPKKEAIKAAQADLAFIGFPFDSTQISRTGANYGPRGIREHSSLFLTYNATSDIDLSQNFRMVDCGDIPVIPGDVENTMKIATETISNIIAGGAKPVLIGGDHSVTIGGARAFAQHHEKPGLILFDTHYDTADDIGGVKDSHCCPISRAVDAGFDPRHMVLIGISGWLNPRTELENARKHGLTVITLDEIIRDGAKAAGQKAARIAGGARDVYLTIDIDALDATVAPGTCVPTAGGMMLREMFEILAQFKELNIGGLDIVEVAPSLDPTKVTQIAANRIILETLAMLKAS